MTLPDAATDALFALTAIAEQFDYEDGDDHTQACPYETLCGNRVCDHAGCIRDKRDRLAEALNDAD